MNKMVNAVMLGTVEELTFDLNALQKDLEKIEQEVIVIKNAIEQTEEAIQEWKEIRFNYIGCEDEDSFNHFDPS